MTVEEGCELQTILDFEERVRKIDEFIACIKELFFLPEISYAHDEALFYAVNLMLKERKELIEARERTVSQDNPSL